MSFIWEENCDFLLERCIISCRFSVSTIGWDLFWKIWVCSVRVRATVSRIYIIADSGLNVEASKNSVSLNISYYSIIDRAFEQNASCLFFSGILFATLCIWFGHGFASFQLIIKYDWSRPNTHKNRKTANIACIRFIVDDVECIVGSHILNSNMTLISTTNAMQFRMSAFEIYKWIQIIIFVAIENVCFWTVLGARHTAKTWCTGVIITCDKPTQQ